MLYYNPNPNPKGVYENAIAPFISTTQFSKKNQNPGYSHCQFVQNFDKELKLLIYFGYWRTKHLKYLVFEKDTKAVTNLVELKFGKLRK